MNNGNEVVLVAGPLERAELGRRYGIHPKRMLTARQVVHGGGLRGWAPDRIYYTKAFLATRGSAAALVEASWNSAHGPEVLTFERWWVAFNETPLEELAHTSPLLIRRERMQLTGWMICRGVRKLRPELRVITRDMADEIQDAAQDAGLLIDPHRIRQEIELDPATHDVLLTVSWLARPAGRRGKQD